MSTQKGRDKIARLVDAEYIYLGGEFNDKNKVPFNRWHRWCKTAKRNPMKKPASHRTKCVCDQTIEYNCWVGKMVNGEMKVKVIGSECINNFVEVRQRCQICATPHKNIKWDLCKSCGEQREKEELKKKQKKTHCISCKCRINYKPEQNFIRCYTCNEKINRNYR